MTTNPGDILVACTLHSYLVLQTNRKSNGSHPLTDGDVVSVRRLVGEENFGGETAGAVGAAGPGLGIAVVQLDQAQQPLSAAARRMVLTPRVITWKKIVNTVINIVEKPIDQATQFIRQ